MGRSRFEAKHVGQINIENFLFSWNDYSISLGGSNRHAGARTNTNAGAEKRKRNKKNRGGNAENFSPQTAPLVRYQSC